MFESTKQFLQEWNKQNSERAKLQHAYAVLALSALVIAGLVGLLNDEFGLYVLYVAFGLTVVFFANAIGWAMLQSFVLQRLPKTPRKR